MVRSSPCTQMMSRKSASRIVKMAKNDNGILEKDVTMNTGYLLSTLEKLYAWEKKLYEEVKAEEKLRVIYAKECKKLKELDNRGADSSKIDATEASIKRLLPKLKVAVSTVDAISRRIHKLRDEELQPQLNELIHGLIGMWNLVIECHKKQLEVMMEAKVQIQMADAGNNIPRNSSLKAIQNLERDILNWGSSFTNWINTQKAFAKFLDGWLMKCLLQEPEDTPNGIPPFSPRSAFFICNDWYRATEKISEAGVSMAISDFSSMLHRLWEKLNEEKHERLKVEYLQQRLKSHFEESGMNNAVTTDAESGGSIFLDEGISVTEDLKLIRNRQKEQKAKHEEVIKQVNDAASQSFPEGLVMIFEALGSFSSEMLKAYEGVGKDPT